ncbi:MAG: hypothetical protein EAY75_17495 [Bacteroidetes bacterium]|nr:MAG: hypothetical protein EAY75_17495 [Bacteroidota bacterium]
MSTTKFELVFEVQMQHTYFTGGLCKGLVLQPLAATAQAFRQFGLLFQPTHSGGKVYASSEKAGTNWRFKSPLPPNTLLQFSLHDEVGNFYPITQWPASYTPGQLMVFSNQYSNVLAGKPLLVQSPATQSFSSTDLFQKVQGTFSFSKNLVTDATVSITMQSSGLQFLQQAPSYKGKISASFNLAEAPAGLAQLAVNGVSEKTLYLLPPTTYSGTIGIVEIVYKPSLPTAYQFMTPTGVINSRTYIIPFLAAAPQWRYKVNRQFSEGIAAITVERENPDAMAFTTTPGPQPGSFISTSNAPIPLHEQPRARITLKNQAQQIIIPHLPNPTPQQVMRGTDGKVYAEMLVTI